MKPGDSLPDPDSLPVRPKQVLRSRRQHDRRQRFLSPLPNTAATSFNWLECFEGEPEARSTDPAIRRIKYEKHGRLARLNVGRTKHTYSPFH